MSARTACRWGIGTRGRHGRGQRRARRGALYAAGLLAGTLVALPPAQASVDANKRAAFQLKFGQTQAGQPTAMSIHIVYRAANDPAAKPSPIRHLVLKAPEGTVFHGAQIPTCTADNSSIQLLGPAACPAATRIGAGRLIVITGLGAPVDPYAADVSIFNTATGFVEIVQPKGGGPTLGVDRITVSGRALSASPPSTPGGPPDGESAIRRIDFQFQSRYVSTPATCPERGHWLSHGTFAFADGATVSDPSQTPCRR